MESEILNCFDLNCTLKRSKDVNGMDPFPQ